ncbi:hypothetical protein [Pseudomonas sp. OTU5201]
MALGVSGVDSVDNQIVVNALKPTPIESVRNTARTLGMKSPTAG